MISLKTLAQQKEITLSGNVEDSFLKTPLTHVKVSVCRADSSLLVDSVAMMIGYNSDLKPLFAKYTATVTTDSKSLLLHAQRKGYDDVWQKVSIGKQNSIEVPTIGLRKVREIELDEVMVKATRVKMFYRGDTIVYDATAFKLPQGSMLDDLIRQMPGVTMNETGEIFVNGRKVDELMLGSRSFMKGNKKVLVENLPYYTVKDIKVYDRQSDKSMALGYDVDPKKFIMDVNLKEEYQQGYIGNVEGAFGTDERWLGRAFVLGFTNRLRMTLLGNVNNVSETRHIGQTDYWTPASMPLSMVTTRSAAAEIDYHTKGDKIKETFNADYTSSTENQQMSQRYEQFLMGISPWSLSASHNRTGNSRLNLHNLLSISKPLYLITEFDFNYAKRDGSFNSSFDQWDETQTASMRTIGISEGRAWNVKGEFQGAFNVGKNKKHIDFYGLVSHNNDESQQANRYETEQYVTSTSLQTHNTNDIYTRNTSGVVNLSYGLSLGKDVSVGFNETAEFNHERTHDYLYHPDTLLLPSEMDMLAAVSNPSNSYDSYNRMFQNRVGVSLHKTGKCKVLPNWPPMEYEKWRIGLNLPVRHESLDYQRGIIDTLATKNSVFLNATASYRLMLKDGKHDIRFNASHNRYNVQILNLIGWRDDSQPFIVRLGNPDLKSNVTSNANIDYYDKNAHGHQQSLHIGASLNYYHRSVAQSVMYAPKTGVYTYKPMNVSGAYTLKGMFDISRTIDEKRYWSWQTNADATLSHSVDHAMLAGESESHLNAVNTITLHEGAYIQYHKDALNIRAKGDVRWRHSEGRMYDFETLNATDFQYGLSAGYTLPRLNATLSADANMYSRRGYGSSELNTNDFVLNAAISQPFFKGKLIARIEAFDLLHNLSSTQYEVNAQGRTETWFRSLPHYVMAHIVYHWNKNPKKK